MKTHADPKYLLLKQKLEAKIRSGELAPGGRLPPCRELAQHYQVSFQTAVRAINLLAAEGLVQSSQGRGSFVREAGEVRDLPRRIALCAPPIEHRQIRQFFDIVAGRLEGNGWEVELCRPASMRELSRCVKRRDWYSMLFGFQLSNYNDRYQLAIHGRERMVILGERYDFFGIPSICVDNSQVIRQALDLLFARGRRRIGLWCNNPAHIDETERVATWRCCMQIRAPEVELAPLLFRLGLRQMTPVVHSARQRLRELDEAGRLQALDAIIFPEEETATVFCDYAGKRGIAIPGDIAVIAINDTLGEASPYHLTTIDTDFSAQLREAVCELEELAAGRSSENCLRTCEPRLILRRTTPPA